MIQIFIRCDVKQKVKKKYEYKNCRLFNSKNVFYVTVI